MRLKTLLPCFLLAFLVVAGTAAKPPVRDLEVAIVNAGGSR